MPGSGREWRARQRMQRRRLMRPTRRSRADPYRSRCRGGGFRPFGISSVDGTPFDKLGSQLWRRRRRRSTRTMSKKRKRRSERIGDVDRPKRFQACKVTCETVAARSHTPLFAFSSDRDGSWSRRVNDHGVAIFSMPVTCRVVVDRYNSVHGQLVFRRSATAGQWPEVSGRNRTRSGSRRGILVKRDELNG